MIASTKAPSVAALLAACAALVTSAYFAQAEPPKQPGAEKPSVELLAVPDLPCGPGPTAEIKGKITGLASVKGLRIILFSKCEGIYYVQPTAASPHTDIEEDGTFATDIHGGEAFVAVLVREGYKPEAQSEQLPKTGADVLAVSPQKKRPASKAGSK